MSACLAAAAVANDAPRREPTAQADVKKLDAEIRRSPSGEWLLTMEYKVKLRAAAGATLPAEPLEMLIEMTDNGRPVVDADGQAVIFVVPLDAPRKQKPGKQEFEGETVISLGNDYAGDVENLRLFPVVAPAEAAAMPAGAGATSGTGGNAAPVGSSAAQVRMQPTAGTAVRTTGGSMSSETRIYAASGGASGLHAGSVIASEDEDEDEDERGFEVEYSEPIRSMTFWLGPFGIGAGH